MHPGLVDSDELVRRVSAVHEALARTRDDDRLLAALAPLLTLHAPARAVLTRVQPDPDAPVPDLVWQPDPTTSLDPAPLDPASLDPAPADPAPHTRSLPLVHDDRELGQLTLHWHHPAAPAPDLDALLTALLAPALGQREALAAHARSTAELTTLLRLGERIAAADEPVDLLAALLAEAPGPDPQAKLLEIGCDPAGEPVTVTVIAALGGDDSLPTNLGRVVDVNDNPNGHIWLDSPNTPVLLPDMRGHSHPGVAAGHRRSQLVAAVLIPLRWQGRWIGLVQLGWSVPRNFGAGERRLYDALGPLLAVLLDNRMLARRLERSLAEQREQAHTLEIVLDHLPVGVQIHDPDTGTRRFNRAAHELLQAHDPEHLPLFEPDSDERIGPEERLSRIAVATGALVTRQRDLQDPDGTRRRLSVSAAPIRDEHGNPSGAVTLFHDISARIAGERARAELRAAVVAAQRAALRERSTPLIPIDDHVLVLPLIGAIDHERGLQIVDTVAHLRGHAHARVVLVDLTGVRDLDEIGARALAEAAKVLRLRGAVPVFTGIGPAVAWTLASLDLDLRGAATLASLRAGLAHAARTLRR